MPAYVKDDHGNRRATGSVDGCGTGVLLFVLGAALALLALALHGAA